MLRLLLIFHKPNLFTCICRICAGIVIFLMVFIFGGLASSKELSVFFVHSTWRIFLHEETKDLYCYGAGYGSWGTDERLIANGVDDFWGNGTRNGPVIVYRKGIEYRWVILKGNAGKRIQGGVLFYAEPKEGYATSMILTPTKHGARIFVDLERGKSRRYVVDIWGNNYLKNNI